MSLIEDVKSGKKQILTEFESKEILKEYDIPVPDGGLATSKEEAIEIAEDIGYPVVMKVMSPDILHKSDAGIIGLDVKDEEEIKEKWDELMDNANGYEPDANILGILINPMIDQGKEVIIGINKDPQFGPVVMFGLGGIFVEILEDVSFRVAPIDEEEAEEMMQEIKGYPILAGARGEDPVDLDALKDIIVKISKLADDLPVKELDLNPVFAYKDRAVAIDARMVAEE